MKTASSSYSNPPGDVRLPVARPSSRRLLEYLIVIPLRLVRAHFFTLCVIAVVLFGWSKRGDNYISAETGIGYQLGIIGGILMLIILLYPISKRSRFLSGLIPVRYWFGIHMLFGIVGPVMILFHCNFQLGSSNSTFALISMLLVAASGLIGRYIYTNIHHGLYGSRITIDELKQEAQDKNTQLPQIFTMDAHLREHLNAMEAKVLQSYTGLARSLGHVIYVAVNARRLRAKAGRVLAAHTIPATLKKRLPEREIVLQSIDRYTLALRKAAAFKVYERLFSYWHVLHMPLFTMMIITAVVHIFAVHLY